MRLELSTLFLCCTGNGLCCVTQYVNAYEHTISTLKPLFPAKVRQRSRGDTSIQSTNQLLMTSPCITVRSIGRSLEMYRCLPYNNTLNSRHHFGPYPVILSFILPTQQNKTKITKAFRQEREREREKPGRYSTIVYVIGYDDQSRLLAVVYYKEN